VQCLPYAGHATADQRDVARARWREMT